MTVGSNDQLVIQDCDVLELAHRYGTPLYVVDKVRLKSNFRRFYDSFRKLYPKIEVSYSYKTNPLPGVIRALHDFGAGAEVISHFELWLALKLNVPPENIIFNGPGKTPESLELAISNKIKLVNIDAADEIDSIGRIAAKYRHRQKVGVRVITSVGWASQFGLSLHNGSALEAFRRLIALEHVVPCGLHIHLGTGIKNVGIYLQAIREILEFSIQLDRNLGIKIQYFDVGGGFGVPTVRQYSALDTKLLVNDLPPSVHTSSACPPIEDYSTAVIRLFKEYYSAEHGDVPTLIFEPGRAITSSAQSLLLKVLHVKPAANGFTNIILDGGKNITMPLAYEYHEVFVASKVNSPVSEGYYNLYGPLCHPSDVVFRAKKLPALQVGDVLAIMDAGAYFVSNQMNFSNPRPSVVILDAGESRVLRNRESFDDIVALDQL
jgi:diaminopimelate decarboxylase